MARVARRVSARTGALAVVAACSGGGAAPAPSSGPAGNVVAVTGAVTAQRAGDATLRPLAVDAPVFADDTLVTAAEASVSIHLRHNDALWTLGGGKTRRVDASAAWKALRGTSADLLAGDERDRTTSAGRHAELEAASSSATAERPETEGAAPSGGAAAPANEAVARGDEAAPPKPEKPSRPPAAAPRHEVAPVTAREPSMTPPIEAPPVEAPPPPPALRPPPPPVRPPAALSVAPKPDEAPAADAKEMAKPGAPAAARERKDPAAFTRERAEAEATTQVRRCDASERAKATLPGGRVVIKLSVAAGGKVTSASVRPDPKTLAPVARCAEPGLRGLTLPAPGAALSVTLTIDLQPQ